MRVAVTNDDGVTAPGIRALARAALARGWDVVVAAPAQEASGSSAAMTAVARDGRIAIEERSIEGLDATKVYAVAASPAFITWLAVKGAFGPAPDVVLSGVNRGANGGYAVLHSGTVGAALTAAGNGCRAIAVSLDVPTPTTPEAGSDIAAPASVDGDHDARRHWHTAATFATDMVPWLIEGPADTVLNLNVPDLPPERVRGLRRGGLARFGQVQMTVAEAGAGFVRMALTEVAEEVEHGTDLAWLTQGYAVVTPIRGVTEARDVVVPLLTTGGR